MSSCTAPAVTWRHGASAAEVARDSVRGPTNPAGLFGSDIGWALPSYPDGSWTPVGLPDAWAARSVPPGVGWYRTQFALHLPSGAWAPLGLKLTPPGGGTPEPGPANSQALIDLDGWLIGRHINNLGPQNTFHLHQGLLRTDGDNTLAIAEWSLAPGAGGQGQVSLVPYEIERGGIPVTTWSAPAERPVRQELRSSASRQRRLPALTSGAGAVLTRVAQARARGSGAGSTPGAFWSSSGR